MFNIEWLETFLGMLALISAAVVTVVLLILLMASQLIEAMSGTTPPTIAWPPQSNRTQLRG